MNLDELQTGFQNVLLGQECGDLDWIESSADGLSSRDRLEIYHNAYRLRLADVLIDTFEHTANYLGFDWFNELAHTYVQANPSVSPNISHYGSRFSAFLANQLADDLEVSELALMDWRLRRAFDGRDSAVMTVDDLSRIDPADSEDIRLQAVPTLSVATQSYNTLEIWQAINEERVPPQVVRLPEPVDLLIWRKGHSPHFRSLSSMESAAIAAVCAGNTLESIGESLAAEFGEVEIAAEFGAMLQRWLADEVLCAPNATI